MANRIQLRRDTQANWERVNPILEDGEPGLDITTNQIKYGDGTTHWNSLPYASGGAGSGNALTNGEYTVSLGADGTLTFPDTATINNGTFTAAVNSSVNLLSNNTHSQVRVDNSNVEIYTSTNGISQKQWTFSSDGVLTFPLVNSQPSIQQQRYGMGNIVGYLDGEWTIGEYNGTNYGTQGIRVSPGIEGDAELTLPSNQTANVNPASFANYSGNVEIRSTNHTWKYDTDGNLVLSSGAKIGGDPATPQVGTKLDIATNYDGQLGGWSSTALAVAYDANIISTFTANSTITFQDGTTANVTGVDNYGPIYIDIFWDPPKSGVLFPLTLKTIDYAAAVDPTAIITVSNSNWQFAADGTLTTPGNITIGTGWGNISMVDTISANNFVYANGVSILSGLGGGTGNVANLVNGAYTVSLAADGRLLLPNGLHIESVTQNPGNGVQIGGPASHIAVWDDSGPSNGIYINTDIPGNSYVWEFTPTGNLVFPDSTIQTTAFSNIAISTYLIAETEKNIHGNVTIYGNLIVNGNVNYVNVNNYVVGDNIINIADGNPADSLDLGFVAHRTVNSILQHTGLIRDASSNRWTLFSNVVSTPGTIVDYTNAVYDDLQVGNITSPTINDINASILAANVGMKGYVDSQTFYSNARVATYLQVGNISNISVAGNVTATYFVGNGALLTGIAASSNYSNVQVATYLPTYSGNIANVRLGVSGVLTFADGTSLATATAIAGSNYGNGNVASYLITNGYVNTNSAYGNGNTASYLITNGYVNTNSAYGNGNVTSYLPTHTGNVGVNILIGTTPNVTLVANSYSSIFDIYGNVAFGNALYPVQISAAGNISTGGYLFGNGAFLTGIVASGGGTSYGNSNVASYLAVTQIAVANIKLNPSGNIVFADGTTQTTAAVNNNYGNTNVKAYTESMGFANYSNVNVAAYLSTNNYLTDTTANLSNYAWNSNVTAANLGMKGYVDSVVGGGSSYGNSNVASYLPTYTGNISAANVTANTISVQSYIDFDLKSTQPAYKEGRLYYDAAEETLVLWGDSANVELAMGQREWVRCRNSTGNTIPKGSPVYVTGVHIAGHPTHGHHPTIDLADASDVTKKDVIGITGEDILPSTHGYVIVRGYIEGLNTANLTAGKRAHLGFDPAGTITTIAPEYPNYPMDLGICLTSNATVGTFYVDIFDHSFERIRVEQGAYVDGDVTVGGNLEVLGIDNVLTVKNLQVQDSWTYLAIGNISTSFSGVGLGDGVFRGHYTGGNDISISVMIDSEGVPDTIKWSIDNFSTLEDSNVAIAKGQDLYLRDGVSIRFSANTGHTLNDTWTANIVTRNADFGVISNYVKNGLYTHAGLFRDASADKFRLFSRYDSEIYGNIDINDGSFTHANLEVGVMTAATFIGDGSQLTGINANYSNIQLESYLGSMNPVKLGTGAGTTSQGTDAVAVGRDAGKQQGTEAVAVGVIAGQTNQGSWGVAIGSSAGTSNQGQRAVAIGVQAAETSQGEGAVAIGAYAGDASQGNHSVAIGLHAADTGQGADAIAVGYNAGQTSQGIQTVAIGLNAGNSSQQSYSVAIGAEAGSISQQSYSVAVGYQAGISNQSTNSTAIGPYAGWLNQHFQATAIGNETGYQNQGQRATAVGGDAGMIDQHADAVAIGFQAGKENQGNLAVAIGYNAGVLNQPTNSIMINASGSDLNGTNAGLYINPVRNDLANVANVVYYNAVTNELTYAPAPAGGTYSNINVQAYTETVGFTNYSNVNVSAYITSTTVPQANVASYGVIQTRSANANYYPLLLDAATGNVSFGANTQLSYNPTTNTLTVQRGVFGTSLQTTTLLAASTSTTVFNTTATIINMGGAANLVNVGSTTSTVTIGSGSGTVSAGNIYLTGNAIIGGAGFTVLPTVITQFTGNANTYTQLNLQNINSGTDATSEYVATANNGTDTTFFVDMGIANSNYDVNSPSNSLGTTIYPNDSYLYAQGNLATTTGGNLAIGTSTANKSVKIFAGGINSANIVATVSNTGVAVTGNVTASGNITASGYIVTAGGYGNISQVDYITANNVVATGNVTVQGMGVTMPNRPAFRVNGTGAPQTTANVNLKGTAISTVFNQGNYFDSTTGKFTAPVAGIYEVLLNARVGNFNGLSQLAVLKNGMNTVGNIVCFWEIGSTSGTANHFGVSGTINLIAGDTLSANILAGNVTFDGNDNWCVTYLG